MEPQSDRYAILRHIKILDPQKDYDHPLRSYPQGHDLKGIASQNLRNQLNRTLE